MKVAIMGAGLSGLACAITLEKNGIVPDVYESRGMVGDRFVTGEVFLSLTARPVQDCIAYLSNEFGIYLHPVNMIRSIHIRGPSQQAVIEGSIGHSNVRGRSKDALENHMREQIQAPITFNSTATYEQLLKDYSHVVIATGDTYYAQQLNNFDVDLSVSMKGAVIKGEFDPYSVYTWLNNDYAPKGYGYVIPLSSTEACMVIAYPDSPEDQHVDIHQLWDRFSQRVSADLKQPLPAGDEFEINQYVIGLCRNSRIGNTFFAGNSFGSVMPFLGFGQYASLLTGAYAARDLCGQGQYEELTKPLRKGHQNSFVLRKAVEQLGNDELDSIVKMLSTPVGTRIFHSRRADLFKIASYMLRPWHKIKTLV